MVIMHPQLLTFSKGFERKHFFHGYEHSSVQLGVSVNFLVHLSRALGQYIQSLQQAGELIIIDKYKWMRSRKRIIECENDLFAENLPMPDALNTRRKKYFCFDEVKNYDILKMQNQNANENNLRSYSDAIAETAFKKKRKDIQIQSIYENQKLFP